VETIVAYCFFSLFFFASFVSAGGFLRGAVERGLVFLHPFFFFSLFFFFFFFFFPLCLSGGGGFFRS